MQTLFRCSEVPAEKKRRQGEGSVGSGTQASSAGTGSGRRYGVTASQVEELAVRTAQVLSLHDIRLREVSTMFRKVKMPVTSAFGKDLVAVDTEWKEVRRGGGKHEGSKHLKLAAVALER